LGHNFKEIAAEIEKEETFAAKGMVGAHVGYITGGSAVKFGEGGVRVQGKKQGLTLR
jgi:hypothetical protein